MYFGRTLIPFRCGDCRSGILPAYCACLKMFYSFCDYTFFLFIFLRWILYGSCIGVFHPSQDAFGQIPLAVTLDVIMTNSARGIK